VRLTADVLAADGGAPMAAVSAGSLALHRAGVPASALVAGARWGLCRV
jgi:polyribonucleotide nucleotidyltransferase